MVHEVAIDPVHELASVWWALLFQVASRKRWSWQKAQIVILLQDD